MRFRQLLNGQLPVPDADTRLLKADDYAALIDASELIETAKRTAAGIVSEAEQEYERQRQRGFLDGQQAARAELAAQRLADADASAARLTELERDAADAVVHAVRRIVGELDDDERVRRIAVEALRPFRDARRVTLRVSPRAASGLAEQLRQSYPRPDLIEVIPDPDLDDDACLIDSDQGSVDAGLQVQLAALAEALRREV